MTFLIHHLKAGLFCSSFAMAYSGMFFKAYFGPYFDGQAKIIYQPSVEPFGFCLLINVPTPLKPIK
jgi:hypothetical protein